MSSEQTAYHFYYDTSKSVPSIYCFDSFESMICFEANNNKVPDHSYYNHKDGIPLFQCEVYNDINVFLNTNNNYLVIYKFKQTPYSKTSDSVDVKKVEYCKVRNYRPLKCMMNISRIHEFDFKSEDKMEMTYFRFHDYVKVKSEFSNQMNNASWIYKTNTDNAIVNGLCTADHYNLFSGGKPIATYRTVINKRNIGMLTISTTRGDRSKIICSAFVLMTHQRLKTPKIAFNDAIL